MSRSTIRKLAALLVVTSAACAAPAADQPTAETPAPAGVARVSVMHNLPGESAVRVFIVPDVGAQALLGVVEGNTTGNFTYTVQQPGGFRLRAQRTTGGNDMISQAFRLTNADVATWNMQLNNVLVRRQ